MTQLDDRIDRIQIMDLNGNVLFSVCNGAQTVGTITMNSGPENNSLVTEAVRRTVVEYGETLRKLSNE
jgi:hypothetical protein